MARPWRKCFADLSAPSKNIFGFLAIAVSIFVVFAALFRSAGVEAQFLRAESGGLLRFAYDDNIVFSHLIMRGYNGHFAPFAFLAELYQAKAFGAHERLWFVRQMALFGLMGAALWTFLRQFVSTNRSAVISALFLAQPIMAENVAWPFMALQFESIIVGLLGWAFVLRFAANGRTIDLALGLLIAYGSMHFFGLGLAFSLAAIVAALPLLGAGPSRRLRLSIVAAAFAATAVHACAMNLSVHGAIPLSRAIVGSDLYLDFGTMFMAEFTAGLGSLWANVASLGTSPAGYSVDAIYGYASLAVLAILAAGVTTQYRARRDAGSALRMAVIALTVSGSVAYAALGALRAASDVEGLVPGYFFGARYVIFLSLFGAMTVAAVTANIGLNAPSARAIAAILILGAIAGDICFLRVAAQALNPALFVSHRAVLQSAENEVATALAEGRPAKNILLPSIGEFGFKASDYQDLIRKDLKLPPNVAISWSE